ncbi:MAG TPA: NAD-dependent epimerase/dehydratase family protein [Dehalococcoidia bacterium]|nr:NAD-dependent epimerase/dehydratase family protein [Dehalococcoidia bacterium]
MKALVTGATGYLGSHIVERLLEQGHEVRALARKTSDIRHLKTTGAEIVFHDIEDYDSLVPAVDGVDVVFHAAARVMPGWGVWEDFENCIVRGTENMLKASAEAKVSRFLYVSSVTVMGRAALVDTPAAETAPYDLEFNRDTYYDWAKMKGEQLAIDYHKQGRLPVTVVRPGMVYGTRCRLLTDRVFRYTKMPIGVWPGRENARTALVYVTDVADCIILAATNEKAVGQVYNVASPEEGRFRDLIAAMCRAAGKPVPLLTIPVSLLYATAGVLELWARLWRNRNLPFLTRSDVRFLREGMHVDGSKAMRELGWEPKVSLEEGCRHYVQWRQDQKRK